MNAAPDRAQYEAAHLAAKDDAAALARHETVWSRTIERYLAAAFRVATRREPPPGEPTDREPTDREPTPREPTEPDKRRTEGQRR